MRAAIAALWLVVAPSALFTQGQPVPSAVRPFPQGLSGTLVFQSDIPGPGNPEARPHLYTIDLATGIVRAVTSGAAWRDENPRWSPDGRRIAFKSTRLSADYDIFVIDADGTNLRRITDHRANDHDPVWMPDGKSLIFSSERDSRGDLYRVWLDDLHVQRLTTHWAGRAIMPRVSPDGRSVAFAAQSLQRLDFWLFQVHVLDLATGRVRDFPARGGACWPEWSPDGRTMARVLLAEEPSVLQVFDQDNRRVREITGDPKLWHYYPDFSSDGRWLAFSVSPEHHAGEDWDLAVARADGTGYTRVTAGPGNDRSPDWKP